MAESEPLTPQDFDAWHLATPLQLLHLMKRLGMESTVIAARLGVKPAAVSQWNRGRRDIPLRYAPGLRIWAQASLAQAHQRTLKEVSRQPTQDLKDATWAEFAGIWHKWTLEVLHHAGTVQRVLEQHYATLGQLIARQPLTRTDRDTIAEVLEHLLAVVDRLVALAPEAPTSEEALLARLTEAHTAAALTHPTSEGPALGPLDAQGLTQDTRGDGDERKD